MNIESDIVIDGIRLQLFKQNNFTNRPTLIFLHDSLGCIQLWRDFPTKLGEATQCNVMVYDRQGYGKSDGFTSDKRAVNYLEIEADTLQKILDATNINEAILFGHSDGGSIALIAAAKYPEKIKAIITEGAHVFVEEITLNGIREGVKAYQETNLKARLEKYHGDHTEAMFWAWAATWLRDDYLHWNIENFLSSIQCPSLIIQGILDEYGSEKQVDAIINGIGEKAQKLMIPDIGHTPHKEASETTFDAAVGFITGLGL